MIATVCDMCRKEKPAHDYWAQVNFRDQLQHMTGQQIDLCPDCWKKVLAFIKGLK